MSANPSFVMMTTRTRKTRSIAAAIMFVEEGCERLQTQSSSSSSFTSRRRHDSSPTVVSFGVRNRTVPRHFGSFGIQSQEPFLKFLGKAASPF